MWWWDQLHKRKEKGGGPVDMGLLMDWTWHVPNDEVVVIAICYPKTKLEIGPFM